MLHDYLQLLDYTPSDLPPAAHRLLVEILQADSLAKKLMGMQLMVEPIALTLFQLVREDRVEPVLADLLAYYERDEARHVALGVHYLPTLINQMSYRELLDFYVWQVRMFMIQLDGVQDMETDFAALGFSPREVVRMGMIKQLHAGRLTAKKTGNKIPVEEFFMRAVEAKLALSFSKGKGTADRWRDALHAIMHSGDEARTIQEVLDRMDPDDLYGPSAAA